MANNNTQRTHCTTVQSKITTKMRGSKSTIAYLITALLTFLCSQHGFLVQAQFGVPKAAEEKASAATTTEVQMEGDSTTADAGVIYLSEQDAADIEALLIAASEDAETQEMVKNMKGENSPELIELSKLPREEILGGLKATLDDLKLIDYLFQDKERALKEMEKEGMIEKKHLKKYKQNPDLLEEDTRRGLYFQFVSLAVVGGYL